MIKVKVDETINISVVERIISNYQTKDICIVINNTKKQSSKYLDEVARQYPNITISVLGGLNPDKKKFNNEHYQSRTYYKPRELSKIIDFYRSIEKSMNLSWTDTQKTMYVYKELCNRLVYSENKVNGKDCSRNLTGLLYGKAVCSGFAMIFKEALDRLGIENFYQNVQDSHSWNVAYIDGKYRAFELTWDCYNKTEKGCEFTYFNRTSEFYKDEYHNLSNEQEEQEYPITPYTMDELNYNYKIINQKNGNYSLGKTCEVPMTIAGKKYILKKENDEVKIIGDNFKSFERKNGSRLFLINFGKYKNLNKYLCIELPNKNEVRISRIFSESRLENLGPENDYIIANGLLSSERLDRKINMFNGYVGYVGLNKKIYYNDNFEKDNLNIIR